VWSAVGRCRAPNSQTKHPAKRRSGTAVRSDQGGSASNQSPTTTPRRARRSEPGRERSVPFPPS
jgi:hypothetical protein